MRTGETDWALAGQAVALMLGMTFWACAETAPSTQPTRAVSVAEPRATSAQSNDPEVAGAISKPDGDGDGVADEVDRCPDKQEDYDGFEDGDGCPDYDSSGHFIPDQLDICLRDQQGVVVKRDDCVVALPVERCQIVLGGKIHFEINKARIKRESYALLDQVVETLEAYIDWTVRIEGHRDSRDRFVRVRISRRRARAVRDYLVAHGIDPKRLIPVGYGESRPIASNRTAEGRAKNRRIEFHIENCKPTD